MRWRRETAARLERRLRTVVAGLAAAREEAEVARAQLEAAEADDEEARVRHLVTEHAGDRREAAATAKQLDAMRRALNRAQTAVAALERTRDELLARYDPDGS